ncbi:MAG TPA: PHB depolymerase family esterase [Caldimonas sp.]|jgi:poly(hydroxyalkanoate) depolymerase family esterase
MHPFLRKILDATRLTRSGRIVEATTAIQQALAPAVRAHEDRAHDRGVGAADAVVEANVVERPAIEAEFVVVPRQEAEAFAGGPADGDAAEAIEDFRPDAPPGGAGRFLASSFTGAAGTRAFKLFVPEGFGGKALPLVVMLHGCTQDPDDFAAGTRMNALAQEHGVLVLYPAQALRANTQKCWNWFSPRHQRRGEGEPALLAGMTRHILQTHSVDHDRVYVAGMSAGGAMAAILAREYPELFAAAGVHSGTAPGSARNIASALAVMKSGPGAADGLAFPFPERAAAAVPRADVAPIPLIVFHGDADATVAAANGDAVVSAALGDAALVATTSEQTTPDGKRGFRRTVWRHGDSIGDTLPVAEHWLVHGSPHAWSGGDASGSYTDPAGPDASREMLRFFLEHPRRA